MNRGKPLLPLLFCASLFLGGCGDGAQEAKPPKVTRDQFETISKEVYDAQGKAKIEDVLKKHSISIEEWMEANSFYVAPKWQEELMQNVGLDDEGDGADSGKKKKKKKKKKK